MPDLSPLPCPNDCEGGLLYVRVCGHTGNCPCADEEQACPMCEGTGHAECVYLDCRRAAIAVDLDDELVCAHHAIRAVCMRCTTVLRPGVKDSEISHGLCDPCEVWALEEAGEGPAHEFKVVVHGAMGATADPAQASHSAGAN